MDADVRLLAPPAHRFERRLKTDSVSALKMVYNSHWSF
jgi:hypothetical protein